jgi:hypothetical protein
MSGESVYATGLTLTEVKYPPELMALLVTKAPQYIQP